MQGLIPLWINHSRPIKVRCFTSRMIWCEAKTRGEWPKFTTYINIFSEIRPISATTFHMDFSYGFPTFHRISSPPTEHYQKCHKWKLFYFIFGPRQTCLLVWVRMQSTSNYFLTAPHINFLTFSICYWPIIRF